MKDLPFEILGTPRNGGFLIIGDHASNDVPDDIVLGIDRLVLDTHIAWDIGVAPVAHLITQHMGFAAYLGGYSRLVVDLNRDELDPAVMPLSSDGIVIPGNNIAPDKRKARLMRFHRPYHDYLKDLLSELYNEQAAASKLAIPFLENAGYIVGDQLPYSGKLLNATMNRHAEANDIPYIGIEMRQDLACTPSGQARFARILSDMCHFVSERLG
jgi:predicted N-formylglutamate amidohydrolase